MAHFAQINEDGIVINVIVAEQDFISSGLLGDPATWIQTSYNTEGDYHPEGKPLRKNFAGIDHTYDRVRNAFIEKPLGQLISYFELNEQTCQWNPHTSDTCPYVWKWHNRKHYWAIYDKETDELVGGWIEG